MTSGAAPPDAGSVPRRALQARVRNIGGTTYLATGIQALELTETAAFVWRALDGTRTVGDIAALLAGEYDVEQDEALGDVIALLHDLAAADVVQY